MTVEELAVLIQGGQTDLKPLLWERVKNLYLKKANTFYFKCIGLCKAYGVEQSDIEQFAYLSFEKALQFFNQDNGFKFLTYCDYAIKYTLREYGGFYSNRVNPLNNCVSFDEAPPQSNEDSLTLAELIQDESSSYDIERLEHHETVLAVYNAIMPIIESKLSQDEFQLLKDRYLLDIPLSDLAVKFPQFPNISSKIQNIIGKIVQLPKVRLYTDIFSECY